MLSRLHVFRQQAVKTPCLLAASENYIILTKINTVCGQCCQDLTYITYLGYRFWNLVKL